MNTQKDLHENLFSFSKEVNDLFGRTKHGFFKNKVRFLANESIVFEELTLLEPVNAFFRVLKRHKPDMKTPFSDG